MSQPIEIVQDAHSRLPVVVEVSSSMRNRPHLLVSFYMLTEKEMLLAGAGPMKALFLIGGVVLLLVLAMEIRNLNTIGAFRAEVKPVQMEFTNLQLDKGNVNLDD